MLRIAQRATGELGGGGAGGPIYGELTPRSMRKVIDALRACGLDARALLLDVGAGRGLPGLVAAQRATRIVLTGRCRAAVGAEHRAEQPDEAVERAREQQEEAVGKSLC